MVSCSAAMISMRPCARVPCVIRMTPSFIDLPGAISRLAFSVSPWCLRLTFSAAAKPGSSKARASRQRISMVFSEMSKGLSAY